MTKLNYKNILLNILLVVGVIVGLLVLYQLFSGNTLGETFKNYGFNFMGDCQGRVNLQPRLEQKEYTFAQLPYYRQYPYFNYYNSPQIIGCGGRRAPCDTRHAIPNVLDPIDVSNRNIAPVTVHVDDNLDMETQKVGSIYKIYDNENQVYPLYGRRLYRNDQKWEYFTRFPPSGEWLRVFQHRQWDELSTNDEVKVEGQCGLFRTTLYDRYHPQYVPFI